MCSSDLKTTPGVKLVSRENFETENCHQTLLAFLDFKSFLSAFIFVGFWKDVVFLYLFCFSSPFLSLAEGDIIVTGKKSIFMS